MADDSLLSQSKESQKKFIHLIVLEKGVKSFYYNQCEVRIKKHKIFVTPNDQDANQIFRTIDNFFRFKNIIVFFARSNGFALIFDHKRHCKHVHNVLQQKRLNSCNIGTQLTTASFEKRFLIPMIQELRNYTELNFDFRIFVLKLFKSLDSEQKQRLAPVLIATKIEQCLLDSVLKGIELPDNDEEEKTIPKLVAQDVEVENKRDKQLPRFCSTLQSASNVAFTAEYSTEDVPEIRSPLATKKPRLSNRRRSSTILPEPITAPFQIIKYTQSGIAKNHLFIFTSEERSHCYEYFWASPLSKYRCSRQGCKKVGPILQKDSDGIEQIYLKNQCLCEPIPFDSDRYKSDINLYQPDYKIVEEEIHGKGGLRRKGMKLYVYASEDKKKAYKFYLDEKQNRFLCIGCTAKYFSIRACTLKNADGVEFVAIQDKEHKCIPHYC